MVDVMKPNQTKPNQTKTKPNKNRFKIVFCLMLLLAKELGIYVLDVSKWSPT